MTMVPARNILRYGGYGGYYTGGGPSTTHITEFELRSDLAMAEEESRTATGLGEAGPSRQVQEGKEGNEEEEVDEERWLQLGLGSQQLNPMGERSHDRQSRLVELDLFSDRQRQAAGVPAQVLQGGGESSSSSGMVGRPMFFQHPLTNLSLRQNQPEISWGAPRLGPWNTMSSPSVMPFYSQQSQQNPFGFGFIPASPDVAGPSTSDVLRVVGAPRRPQSGIWFLLRASNNQAKEPSLPQIRKSYLRIKDGRMTIRLLMRYLANKLGLNNESELAILKSDLLSNVNNGVFTRNSNWPGGNVSKKEIEITCKGQQLLPLMTLQHVRDSIWCSRDPITLLPDSTAMAHVMILQYGRSA